LVVECRTQALFEIYCHVTPYVKCVIAREAKA
jgi:hypothetical protein